MSDITYVPTDEGWLYLAGHKDLFTKEIVGYAMGERLSKNLVSESLFRAIAAKSGNGGRFWIRTRDPPDLIGML